MRWLFLLLNEAQTANRIATTGQVRAVKGVDEGVTIGLISFVAERAVGTMKCAYLRILRRKNMSFAEMQKKRAALVAQCPIPVSLTDEDCSKLPIHVDISGEGPRIVIIHGGVQGNVGGGPATFINQKALASRGWQVEIVDRPGFGGSPSRGVDDMLRDAIWIAEMLGSGAHLVGHSFGGAEVLLAAARRPEAVLSLTLVEPALQALDAAVSKSEVDQNSKPSMAEQMMDILMSSASPAEYIRHFLDYLGISATVGDLDEDPAMRLGCSMLQARMAEPGTLLSAAEAVSRAGIPVLAISGGWSEAIDNVCKAVTRCTGGRYVEVPSTNHYPQLENSETFNNVLDAFLRETSHA